MQTPSASTRDASRRLRPLPNFIFMSRWLQLPLYLGLILAQCVYVYHFWLELIHLLQAAMGSGTALSALISGIGYERAAAMLSTTSAWRIVVLGMVRSLLPADAGDALPTRSC